MVNICIKKYALNDLKWLRTIGVYKRCPELGPTSEHLKLTKKKGEQNESV